MSSKDTQKSYIFWVGLTVFLWFASCKKSNAPLNDMFVVKTSSTLPAINLDPELVKIRDAFVEDAKKRGVIIPNSTLDMLRVMRYVERLSVGGGSGVVAACSRYIGEETKATGFWSASTQELKWLMIEVLKKEAEDYAGGVQQYLIELLYHELYHCLLNKGHLPAPYVGLMSPVFHKGNSRPLKQWPEELDEAFSPKFMALTPDVDF